MPIEIRELVIQAQVIEGHQQSDNADTLLPSEQKEKKMETLEMNRQLAILLATLLNEFKKDFQKELRLWVKDYMAQQNRRF